MRARLTTWLALALTGAALHGCTASTPYWDARFGAANRANLAAQVIDPAAAANANPATGVDGRAARAVYERYQQSYVRPEQPATLLGGR